jgi:release factor glutamine methyltransferase
MKASTMADKPKQKLHPEFQRFIDQQPYQVALGGLTLTVDNDVFPPDMGKCSQNLARIAQVYHAQAALDMGCGSGYLALSLKRSGVPEVWASDIHAPAVACARKNAIQNEGVGPIHLVQSDLFENIPAAVKFDLIIFNQPFGPGQGDTVCGCGPDGGYNITKRFLLQAADRLNPEGVVIMAFSDREPAINSPDRVAAELGYPVKVLLNEYYGGATNTIYEICPLRVAAEEPGFFAPLALLGTLVAESNWLQSTVEGLV